MKENRELFKANEETDIWINYIEYLDDIVLDGLFNCIQCSLQYFLDNTDKEKTDMPPLLLTKMELQAPELVFEPSLEQEAPNSFYTMVEELLDDMFKFASLVPRVAVHKGMDDYLPEVEELADLLDMREEVLSRVSAAVDKVMEYQNSFDSYAYLWVDDRQEFMRQFLRYGHVLTAEEVEQAGDEGVPENPPTLRQFKEQVDSYETVHAEVIQFKVRMYGVCAV